MRPTAVLRLEDEVKIVNCPPVSARKRFALQTILNSEALKRACKQSTSEGKPRDYEKAIDRLNLRRRLKNQALAEAKEAKEEAERIAAKEARVKEEMERAEKNRLRRGTNEQRAAREEKRREEIWKKMEAKGVPRPSQLMMESVTRSMETLRAGS